MFPWLHRTLFLRFKYGEDLRIVSKQKIYKIVCPMFSCICSQRTMYVDFGVHHWGQAGPMWSAQCLFSLHGITQKATHLERRLSTRWLASSVATQKTPFGGEGMFMQSCHRQKRSSMQATEQAQMLPIPEGNNLRIGTMQN